MKFKTIEWKKDCVRILDQRKLPHEIRYLDCKDASTVAEAIRTLAIRGAPAIGVAAAMGIALAARKIRSHQPEVFRENLREVIQEMGRARPTAVNLFWALDRMRNRLVQDRSLSAEDLKESLEEEALKIFHEDVEANRKIGEFGKSLIRDGDRILTHCNAGALATVGYGTALGVLYAAWSEGKRFHVFVDETRPLLQGARLTAWELTQGKIPATVITDSMAAWVMKKEGINLVLVGADRIARNGDTANKIGTYGLAILSKWHGIPFYVAAPTSTVDLDLVNGLGIPIEERDPSEVTHIQGKPVTPKGIKAFNPAFDITPQFFIKAIITEKEIIRKPFVRHLKRIRSG
ncbi:MAG: S-methyl-5-thioribose-1-phosphate isomerase [Deltaproteobacteria bacterium RBG_16_48_10]|nr:MAG: S-methyl-5-thioribose-1-phosphate isomerase [Deltaproteobacteria bacterium RBG_16_48_10]